MRKYSYSLALSLAMLCLFIGATTPIHAAEWRVDRDGPNSGNFSWAWAYVGGWWWGTAYCGTSHVWNWSVSSSYPYGGYVVLSKFGECGYQYAWTKTEVYLYNAWGKPFRDSVALAVI